MTKPKWFQTCAIDYPNSRPHIGTAFEKLGEFAPILGLDLRNSALIKHVSSLLSEMQSQAELEPTA